MALNPLSPLPTFGQTVDALGNIFDAAGNHIGVKPGSIADIGTPNRGTATSQTSSGVPTTNASPTQANDWRAKLQGYFDSLSHSDPGTHLLEDAIFIVLGLLLVAGAIFSFVFTFKQTQQVVKAATGKARGALDAKVAEALVA
jgi:hypothetical protein